MKLIQLKYKDVKPLREKLHKEQNYICPVLKQKVDINDVCVDHIHKRKNDNIGINGCGLVRGIIHTFVNSFEGKVLSSYKRSGLKNIISLPDLLRHLADYLEQKPLPFIHPTEAPKPQKLMKTSYNYLKSINTNNKFPEYPKSKKLTAPLKKLYEKYNIEPKYYKS